VEVINSIIMKEWEELPMTYSKMLGQYKRVGVETAGTTELVVMCYEKALEMLRSAKRSFEEKEFEKKGKALKKALEVINTLQSTLDMEKGGQIAKNLEAIYIYLTRRLLEGDIRKDLTAFDEAVRILSELKEAWEAIASPSQSKPGAIREAGNASLSQIAA
jgi:flagellar secretion chaperone FliS